MVYVNQAKKYLATLIQKDSVPPIMLWSAPGCGKSSIVKQVVQETSIGLIDIRLLYFNPIDLRGIPRANPETRVTEWYLPDFLPRVERDGERGILFLDELPAAPPATQAASYQLMLDRKIGDYELPSGWKVVAAGNRMTDRAVVHRMPSPLANRMLHFDLEVSLDDWKEWAIDTGVHPAVIAFLSFRPELLYKFPEDVPEIKGFPTPRSWEFVSSLIDEIGDSCELAASAVGEGAALEFITFKKTADRLPSPKKIIDDKQDFKPDSPDLMYALASGLVSYITANFTRSRVARLFDYISFALPVEFQTLVVTDLLRTKYRAKLCSLQPFLKWAKDNTHVINAA